MRYVGSKKRLAPKILEVIQQLRGERNTYIEPFLGGANSFKVISPHFTVAVGIELCEDIALMWQAVRDGRVPPTEISEEEYEELRTGNPSARRGFVGFGGSFGGKWFGGYARGGFNSNGQPRNYQAESARAVLKNADTIKRAKIIHGDYSLAPVTSDCVVYCDPPYEGTIPYGAVGEFDSQRFWRTCEVWTRIGALVVVSEYTAPPGWSVIREFSHRQSVSMPNDRRETIERLFMFKG